jgi:hypothetical protein
MLWDSIRAGKMIKKKSGPFWVRIALSRRLVISHHKVLYQRPHIYHQLSKLAFDPNLQ